MSFNNYYLWLLIDTCHNEIDEIITGWGIIPWPKFRTAKIYLCCSELRPWNYSPPCSATIFTKHTNFNSFVKEFLNLRQQAKDDKNEGLSQFCKLTLNSAFGGGALNSEKYSNTRLLSANMTFIQHMMGEFFHSTELNNDLYAVQVDRENCRCNTCLQVAYFVLDSAKFWMHFVQGDTDSLTWAISGNPNRGPEQLFDEVIKNQGFFDRYKDCVILDQNPQINEQTFIDCINKGSFATAINTTLAQRKGTISSADSYFIKQ
ncbi:MAG: hypothetical protein EZS28_005822 [Streblomastix strix]|uniref:DNA-directed DNA polymerase n=1 Tax=Streblomastix strix TaxID=222440 RepID=A0A5J4WWN6_9EUKA|nr:MAG: hypothetical protein EZS28_005822 [Streblomastix strix]